MWDTPGEARTNSNDESIPKNGRASVGQPVRIYQQQFCVDLGCSLEDLLGAMDDRDR